MPEWFCHACNTDFELPEDEDATAVSCVHCGGAFVELMPPPPPPEEQPDSSQGGGEDDLSDAPYLGEEELGAAEIFFNLAFFSDERRAAEREEARAVPHPGASEAALASLKQVEMTAEQIEVESECAICKCDSPFLPPLSL